MDLSIIFDLFCQLSTKAWNFANTNFSAALFGAFAGAYGGQWIVEKSHNRRALVKEMRGVNAAVMVALGICNTCLALKKQHVKPLKDRYENQKRAFEQFRKGKQEGTIPMEQSFQLSLDLQSLQMPTLPVEILHKLLFEEISLEGRPLFLASNLPQSIDFLNDFIEKRNGIITNAVNNGQMTIQQYLGLPSGRGVTDENYPTVLEGISLYTNDCIHFSHLLCEDLVAHGKKLKKRLGREAPPLFTPDFTMADDLALMPNSKDYDDWSIMFPPQKPPLGKIEAAKRLLKSHFSFFFAA